jgi:hypothetical protein
MKRCARAESGFLGEEHSNLQGADQKVCVMEASRAAEDDMIDNGVLVLIIRAS